MRTSIWRFAFFKLYTARLEVQSAVILLDWPLSFKNGCYISILADIPL